MIIHSDSAGFMVVSSDGCWVLNESLTGSFYLDLRQRLSKEAWAFVTTLHKLSWKVYFVASTLTLTRFCSAEFYLP